MGLDSLSLEPSASDPCMVGSGGHMPVSPLKNAKFLFLGFHLKSAHGGINRRSWMFRRFRNTQIKL